MRSRMTLCAVMAALICLSGLASGAEVTLRYKMAKGDKLVYLGSVTGNGQIQAMGQTTPLAMTVDFRYVLECTEVDGDGHLTLVHRFEGLKASAMQGNQPVPVQVQLPTVLTVITPTGKILRTEVQKPEAPAATGDAGAAGGLGGLMSGVGGLNGDSPLDVAQLFGSLAGQGFPEAAVHPGSRWKDTLKLTNAAGQAMNVDYVTSFLDCAVLNERPCARLQTDYEAPLDMALTAAQLFNLTGKTKGTGIAYFDYEAGRVLRYDGMADMLMTMSVPQLFSGGGAGQQATANVRTTLSVVLAPQP